MPSRAAWHVAAQRQEARIVGMLGGSVTIASGAILSEYYGKDIEDYDLVMRSRRKNGTNDFLGHLAV